MERGGFFTCALKKGGISGIHTFFLFLSQTGTLSSLIPPFDRFHFDKSINPFLRDYSEMIKKKKCYEFSFKAWLKTRSVRSQRGKIGKKKGNRESSLRGYRVKTRQASEERENLLWNHAVTNPAQRRITELYPLLPLNPR